VEGTISRVNEFQLLLNQELQATTGYFWTTNLGGLSMESGLRVLKVVGIYGSIKGEDCITVLCWHKISIHTGRASGQRMEDYPPRASVRKLSHVRMPPYLQMPPYLWTPAYLWTPPHLRTPPYLRTPPNLQMPPLVSHVRTPPHLQTPPYSDTSPHTEDEKEHRREGEKQNPWMPR